MFALAPCRSRPAIEAPGFLVLDLSPGSSKGTLRSVGTQSRHDPDSRPLAGVRVLVVEDEVIVALDLVQMLEDLGAEVCGTAASGADALLKARALRPDMAIVDIRLKDGETGIDAAQTMAAEMGVAIVFATAHTDPRLADQMQAVLGSLRLAKPYTVDEVAQAARRALRRQ